MYGIGALRECDDVVQNQVAMPEFEIARAQVAQT